MTRISNDEPSRERPRAETYFDDEGGMFFANGDFLEYFDEFRHRWTVIAQRPIKLPELNRQPRLTQRPAVGASLLRTGGET